MSLPSCVHKEHPGDLSLSRVLVWSAQMVVLLGTIVYSYCLDMKFLDALYFTVVTVTTVGFGDYCPTSTSSKIFN